MFRHSAQMTAPTMAGWACFLFVVMGARSMQTTLRNGGGACASAADCMLAGVCVNSVCVCDPGWAGASCEVLDLAPLDANSAASGAAWNSEHSPRSSWGSAVISHPDSAGRYHGWFNQLPGECGLSSWLPGSQIVHGVATSLDGPYVAADPDRPLPNGARSPLSTFATNPHVIKVNDTYVMYFNGRRWPVDDITDCAPNRTGAAPWHGGGACTSDGDCPGAFAGTPRGQPPGKCVSGVCQCEHHSFGPHCDQIVETVNVASATDPEGPWTQLLPDGAPFFSDGNTSLALSNPSGFALSNGTIVLAYSRAPGIGVSRAPHWSGPYERIWVPTPPTWHNPDGRNYSVACPSGEDPFIYQDFRGTYRILFHGGTVDGVETGGQTFSTDLVHWTWPETPVYTSVLQYSDGTTRVFARRERPALALDEHGFPTQLFTAVQGPGASYSCHNSTDRGCHAWSLVQRTRYGQDRSAEWD